jgi:hypothetical protein
VLAVVVALWLNLAVQPCAMAFSDDHDCPHCPPEQDMQMAGHHGHQVDKAETDCDSSQPDCGDIDDFSLDGRNTLGKLKAKPLPVAIVAPVSPTAALSPIGFSTTAADPPDPVASTTPLHLIYCVFLD